MISLKYTYYAEVEFLLDFPSSQRFFFPLNSSKSHFLTTGIVQVLEENQDVTFGWPVHTSLWYRTCVLNSDWSEWKLQAPNALQQLLFITALYYCLFSETELSQTF